jgi:AcrR family transcriptional regulator
MIDRLSTGLCKGRGAVSNDRQNGEGHDVLWQRDVPTSRGGAAAAEIAAAAVAIADREGLQAVSVKRVATKTGMPLTQLSRFLTSKEDLHDLMFDAFYSEVAGLGGSGDWRAELQEIARSTKAAAQRHPWVLGLIGSRPPYGPNGLRSSEIALEAVDGLGLEPRAMVSAVNTILSYVYGSIRVAQTGEADGSGAQSDSEGATARYLIGVVSNGEYPALAKVLGETGDYTAEDSFEAGLQHILDAVAAQAKV